MKRIFLTTIIIVIYSAISFSQFKYDNLNRLSQVTYANGTVVNYTFDELGNRTTKTVKTATVTVAATANPVAGGTVTGAGSYTVGQSCTLAATASTGYSFVNWTENGVAVSTSASYVFTVAGARTLVANFVLNSVDYSVSSTSSPTAGGTITGNGTYKGGASCTLAATANTGYTFVNWTEGGIQVSTLASYTFTVGGNRTLVANFTQNPINYTVAALSSPTAGGSIVGSGTYQSSQACTLIATPNTGYSFVNWTENGVQASTLTSYTFVVSANKTLVANFTQNPINYTISVSSSPTIGGSIVGSGTYQSGQACTLIATPNTGYTFVNWTENGVQVSIFSSCTFIVNGNRTLVANFTSNPIDLTTGLVAYYTFNGNVNDESGNGNNGRVGSGNSFYIDNSQLQNNLSCKFLGVDSTSYVKVVNSESLKFNNNQLTFSINAKLNPFDDLTNGKFIPSRTGQLLFKKGGLLATIIPLGIDSVRIGFQNGDGNCAINIKPFNIGQWNHYVFTILNDSLNIYLNGEKIASKVLKTNFNSYPYYINSSDLVFGSSNNVDGSLCLKGLLDEMKIYNRALNYMEIRTLYSQFYNETSNINITSNSVNGSISGGGVFNNGETHTVIATPKTGYMFTNWSENGIVASKNENYQFKVSGNRSLIANFIPNTSVPNVQSYGVKVYSIDNNAIIEGANGWEVRIIDISGRTILIKNSTSDRFEIHIPISGLYLIRLSNKEKTCCEKVVIQ